MIQFSDAALREIKRLKSKQQSPDAMFRLAVKAGGCSGWYYDMSFEQTIDQTDSIFEASGIKVIIDAPRDLYLKGLTLDYSEDLMGGGFRFNNPQAIATCGCGNSFSF